jgi:hypothetical protein
MLPKKGIAHAICLLSHAATLKRRTDIDDWVSSASALSASLSVAADLRPPAEWLVHVGFVVAEDHVIIAPPLKALSGRADRSTLLAIARLTLRASPPGWLPVAVGASGVVREYIPSRDLEALLWIDPDLDALLMDVGAEIAVTRENAFKERMGAAAEALLIAAFERAGRSPLHVSKLSDAYGYDIEMSNPAFDRVEVKAAGINTSGRFMLTRNEYNKSLSYGSQWRLVQVVFSASAFAAERLHHHHVEAVLQLKHGSVAALVPPDTPGFVWMESAELKPDPSCWTPLEIELDPCFTMTGFR